MYSPQVLVSLWCFAHTSSARSTLGAVATGDPTVHCRLETRPDLFRPMTASMVAVSFLFLSSGAIALDTSDEAQGWREYARLSLQASLGGASADAADPRRKAVGDSDPYSTAVSRLALSVQASFASEPLLQALPSGTFGFSGQSPLTSLSIDTSRFSTSIFAPQVQARLGETSEVRFGLTVASQRFATPGFGEVRASSHWLPQMGLRTAALGAVEQSYGQGVHLGIDSALGEYFRLGASAQSRVDMDAFKTYRGLFSEPGDFDVPARTGLSFGVKPLPSLAVSVGAERVFYSDVAAFTTYALPTQLLALLGDGSAPTFAWRDLNVYSAKAELDNLAGGQWSLQVTTRQQPSPTSALFDLALQELYSGNHYALSYRRQMGVVSNLSIGASYAPAQYILGPNPFRNRYRDGSQLEVELNWSVAF